MRTAVAAAILVVAVFVAGCAGPDDPGEDVEGPDTTTFTENEQGANPDRPDNATQEGMNETQTAETTQPGGEETNTTEVNASIAGWTDSAPS